MLLKSGRKQGGWTASQRERQTVLPAHDYFMLNFAMKTVRPPGKSLYFQVLNRCAVEGNSIKP
jgi:hypothetical protein